MSKKPSGTSARHSLTIRSKLTSSRILEITNDSLKMEMNESGIVTGKYNGTQLATVEGKTVLQLGLVSSCI